MIFNFLKDFSCLVFNWFPCIYLLILQAYALCGDLYWNSTDIVMHSSSSHLGQIASLTGFSREFSGHCQAEVSISEVITSPTLFNHPQLVFFQYIIHPRVLWVKITLLYSPQKSAGYFSCPTTGPSSACWRGDLLYCSRYFQPAQTTKYCHFKSHGRTKFWQVTSCSSLPVLLSWQIDSWCLCSDHYDHLVWNVYNFLSCWVKACFPERYLISFYRLRATARLLPSLIRC